MTDLPPLPSQDLLRALPDDPMHVEVRGLLMCRSDVSLLPDPAAPTKNGFLFAPLHGLAVGYGTPPVQLIDGVRELANRFGMTGQDVELNLPHGAAPEWLAHGRVTGSVTGLGEHRVQAFTEPAAFERILDLVTHDVIVITDPSDPRLQTLPVALQAEFGSLCPWPAVVAIMAEGRMASIAYAFVETEGFFDISIDTPHLFRREGYGLSCAAGLIRHQIHRGKHPVWIARENNAASLALSARLGFQDVGGAHSALLR